MPPDIQPNLLMGGRADFAALCDAKGLKTAIEIGTDRGVFAREFLDRWHGEMLYCVDPYESYPEMEWDRQGDLLLATALLAPHARRVRFIRASTVDAVRYFAKGEPLPKQVGFIYIDGAHDAFSVAEDLSLWWDFLQPGGVFAGDDFGMESVRAEVISFAQDKGLAISLISDYNRAMNWCILKPL